MTKKQRSVFLIANPNAGRGGNRRALAIKSFCEALRRSGLRVEAEATAEPGDAARLAKRAVLEGWREIIVAGGDGTLNEALQGLAGSAARLGMWPNGTANVMARELNLPFKAERIAEMIARGNSRTISYGCARDEISGAHRYFFLMAGIGLDASVVRGTSLELKRRAGVTAFWYSGLQHLKSWQPIFFDVEINGQTYEATFAAIGKAAHYGGNLAITPRARLDEAQFEICLIESDSRLRYLHLLSHALRSGGINEHLPQVRFFNAPRVRATGKALVQVDGELIGALPMSFEIAAQRIEIIVP